MKKKIIIIFLIIFTVLGSQPLIHAEDIDSLMQKFKSAQSKLRELRQNGASQTAISTQEEKVRELRSKVNDFQKNMGE